MLKKLLNFFRLIDETGSLSLSNIAMIVTIVKMAMTATFSMADAALLLPVIGNYTYKRYTQRKQRYSKENNAPIPLEQQDFKILKDEVEKMKIKLGFEYAQTNRSR